MALSFTSGPPPTNFPPPPPFLPLSRGLVGLCSGAGKCREHARGNCCSCVFFPSALGQLPQRLFPRPPLPRPPRPEGGWPSQSAKRGGGAEVPTHPSLRRTRETSCRPARDRPRRSLARLFQIQELIGGQKKKSPISSRLSVWWVGRHAELWKAGLGLADGKMLFIYSLVTCISDRPVRSANESAAIPERNGMEGRGREVLESRFSSGWD